MLLNINLVKNSIDKLFSIEYICRNTNLCFIFKQCFRAAHLLIKNLWVRRWILKAQIAILSRLRFFSFYWRRVKMKILSYKRGPFLKLLVSFCKLKCKIINILQDQATRSFLFINFFIRNIKNIHKGFNHRQF